MDFTKLKQFMMDKANAISDDFNQYVDDTKELSKPIEEKDETTYLGTGFNRGINPKLWMSVAQQKRQQQAIDNASGMIGGIGKVGKKSIDAAEAAVKKLEEAIAQGHKPTAAETMALAKYKGELPVIPSYEKTQQAKRQFEAIKEAEEMQKHENELELMFNNIRKFLKRQHG